MLPREWDADGGFKLSVVQLGVFLVECDDGVNPLVKQVDRKMFVWSMSAICVQPKAHQDHRNA